MAADEVHVWEWPDALDALMAEPKDHRFLFENDEDVRLLDTSVRPGEVVATQTHRWPGVLYVFSSPDFVRRDSAAGIVLEPETALSTSALAPHVLENVGDTEIRVLHFEVER